MFSTDLGRTSLPTRGIFYSILVHGLFAAIVLEVPWDYWMLPDVHLVSAQHMQEHEVLLLPNLDPIASSPAAPSGKSGDAGSKPEILAAAPSTKAAQGVVYKGPQLIISNPPHPDNFVQTIQQPDLVRKLKLPAPLAVPSLVSIAPAKPLLAPPVPQPTPEPPHPITPPENQPVQVAVAQPITLPQEQPKVEAPKLPLPSADDHLRTVSNSAVPAQMPKLAHPNPPVKSGTDAHNILVVNAIPVPEHAPAAIPPGEVSGAFTVLPVPLSARPGATKLAGGGLEISGVPGIGNGTGTGAGVGTASSAGGGGTNSTGGGGAGKAVRAGAGSGTGIGRGGTGHDQAGNGSGRGGLQISVNRGASGSGSGNSPFPGIMIQGGSGGGRSVARAPLAADAKAQTSYGITIVANGASGGGFKDFGVFQDEASYTVYLDMADTGLPISSWTLQYALYSHRLPGPSHVAQVPHGLLTPPYAITKTLPRFSSEVAKRAAGTTIVVFGIVNLQGKFEDLRVMQSPDPVLNQPLLDSLAKWTFQPAKMDGAHVPVKFLLGVPVNSVPRA